MRRLMAQVAKAAQSDVTVLVTGESGTGKELVARALHDLGPRRTGPFVTVDCGSLPPTLIASIYGMNFKAIPELDWRFGYVYAIGVMIASVAAPFLYFRRKGWLR
jgi:transcriptional regulator of aromatic amino acid metabolism